MQDIFALAINKHTINPDGFIDAGTVTTCNDRVSPYCETLLIVISQKTE